MKTTHKSIGYSENIDIIEEALRCRFGIDDDSFLGRAVAAHIWSYLCQSVSDEKEWGETEIALAVIDIQRRLNNISAAITCKKNSCGISYPHSHDSVREERVAKTRV